MTCSTTSPITPKSARAVSFSPRVSVLRTTHLKTYTQDEIDACWYTESEKKLIRKQAMRIVKKMSNDDPSSSFPSKYCTRGLESLTADGRKAIMDTRFAAWDAVLDEQELQMSEGVTDQTSIAQLYMECTYKSSFAASQQGLEDQRAVTEAEVLPVKKEVKTVRTQPVYYATDKLGNKSATASSSGNNHNHILLTELFRNLEIPPSPIQNDPVDIDNKPMKVDDLLSVLDEVENTLSVGFAL